eukprot:GHVH01011726.1.p1 GENE.GHVH01011726.1~~GHVH01011726.1.p1  ORF type:complete len:553 (-),score=89.10 GHVH01011726.1:320-1861(-)
MRDTGNKARLGNIQACRAIAGIVRTTLGPSSALKMMIDPMGGIVLSNDGHAVLREVDVAHPAAKSVLEVSRSQDEEVGDGTTSVVILTGELVSNSEEFFTKNPVHPVIVFRSYLNALDDCLRILDTNAVVVDEGDTETLNEIIMSSMDTKFSSRYGSIIPDMALKAARCVLKINDRGDKDIDIKRYAKVEKIPGATFEDSHVVDGIMLNKDLTHRGMRQMIMNPRIVLLDSSLEYKKGESQTTVEITADTDFEALLAQEEAEIERMCNFIISVGCDLVITEKGVSDLAQHFLMKAGISVIRRVKKTDNNRISRCSGSTIVNRLDELRPEHVGHKAKLFKIDKIGDEYYSYITECEDPHACTIVLRGGSKDSLNEIERNLQDALCVARNLLLDPRLLPGGGAIDMSISVALAEIANTKGVMEHPYRAVANAFEVIPKTLIQNCGGDVIRRITELRAVHNSSDENSSSFGIDGKTGDVINVVESKIWDSYAVKVQSIKTALELASRLETSRFPLK